MEVDRAASTFMRLYQVPYMFHVSLIMQRCINNDTASAWIRHLALGSFGIASKHCHVKSISIRSYENHPAKKPKRMQLGSVFNEQRDQTALSRVKYMCIGTVIRTHRLGSIASP